MDDLESDIRQSFISQAISCETLGSPFTARLCRLLGRFLDAETRVGARVFAWPGDYTAYADNLALRLCGAINHLVLTGKDEALEAAYPPSETFLTQSDETVWEQINAALNRHADAVIDFLQTAPQTNEVRRSAGLIPAYHAIAARYNMPIDVYELGASAGLNLYPDLYGIQTSKFEINQEAALQLTPEWNGKLPQTHDGLDIRNRNACDLAPIDIQIEANCTKMLAYIWPDQMDRVRRTKLAIKLARENRDHRVEEADAIAWLEKKLRERREEGVSVFHHTVAWQYFPAEAKEKGEALFTHHGQNASPQAPLVRLSLESDGQPAEQGARFTMTVWPNGEVIELGRVDFHGRWVNWQYQAH